jgi:hypothetical protein
MATRARENRRDKVLRVRFLLDRRHTRTIYRSNGMSHETAGRPRISLQRRRNSDEVLWGSDPERQEQSTSVWPGVHRAERKARSLDD